MFDPKKLAAEFVGTFILVFIAVGVATENFGFKLFGTSYAAGVVTTALAFGLVLMALAYAIGPISGCHVNPAVTLGFVAAGRMKVGEGARLRGGPVRRGHRRRRRAVADLRGHLPPTAARCRGWAPTATARPRSST